MSVACVCAREPAPPTRTDEWGLLRQKILNRAGSNDYFILGSVSQTKVQLYPLCSERRTPSLEARERHPYRTRTADAHILRNRLVCRSPHVCPDLLAVRKERRRTFPGTCLAPR